MFASRVTDTYIVQDFDVGTPFLASPVVLIHQLWDNKCTFRPIMTLSRCLHTNFLIRVSCLPPNKFRFINSLPLILSSLSVQVYIVGICEVVASTDVTFVTSFVEIGCLGS
jgi:hypothetical protein